jgi:undecaprenyl-diphosphatase
MIRWDTYFFYEINHVRSDVLDVVMPFITDFDNWIPMIIVIALAMVIKGGKKERLSLIGIGLVILMADQIASGLLKPLFDRPRPCVALPDVYAWKIKSSASFASSHAANIAGVATYYGWKYPKALPILAILAILIGWSRIYLGYHYPLDVLAGFFIGIYAGVFITLIEKLIAKYFIFPRFSGKR